MVAQNISVQKRPGASIPSPFPGELPQEHGMQGTGRARQRGGFHHLQDIRHRMMQSQWQRQKQCQIHSLLTIVWPQPPQRAPGGTLRMPGTPCRPGFTSCNQSPTAAAQWAWPLKYLIGPFSSPITTLRGVWSQASLSGLSHNNRESKKSYIFCLLPQSDCPAFTYVQAIAMKAKCEWTECSVVLGKKWLQLNVQDQVHWQSSFWSQGGEVINVEH